MSKENEKRKNDNDDNIKAKISKKKHQAHFQSAWKEDPEFTTWIAAVRRNMTKAFCNLCRSEFSVGASGVYDVRAHSNGVNHRARAGERSKMKTMQTLFAAQETSKASLTLE